MISAIADWLSIIGFPIAIIGFAITLWQIYSLKRITEAAKEASEKTQSLISKNLLMVEITACVNKIGEIQLYLQQERYEFALMRVKDFSSYIEQVQGTFSASSQFSGIDFDNINSIMSEIAKKFEKKILASSTRINAASINGQLGVVSKQLNNWIGKMKVDVLKENDNG